MLAPIKIDEKEGWERRERGKKLRRNYCEIEKRVLSVQIARSSEESGISAA